MCFKDLSNAFAGSSWERMDAAVEEYVAPEDQAACRLRYREAVAALPAGEGGRITLKTQQGGLMGDPYIVQAFNGTFRQPIDGWREDAQHDGPCSSELVSSWEGHRVGLSLLKYADDLHNFSLADYGSTLPDFANQIRKHDILLNSRLGPCGFGQNMSKQEYPPERRGGPPGLYQGTSQAPGATCCSSG
eukprot:9022048-Pyramimonas_sp.AAC.1